MLACGYTTIQQYNHAIYLHTSKDLISIITIDEPTSEQQIDEVSP